MIRTGFLSLLGLNWAPFFASACFESSVILFSLACLLRAESVYFQDPNKKGVFF